MRQIEFATLHEALLAIKSWQGFRVLYVQNPTGMQTPELFSYGDNGIVTIKSRLFSLYDLYLRAIPIFDETFKALEADFSEFDNEDLIQQRINPAKYKSVILRICDQLDEIEKHIKKYYQVAPLFQIYNSTFQTDTLFYYINNFYRPEVWSFVPEDSQRDLAEGARCILFDLPTAGVFILLRGLEGCIRVLHEKVVGTLPPKGTTMGVILNALEAEYTRRGDEEALKQLAFLGYIKEEYRNPSAHPGEHFDKGQAEKLFQMANVAIEKVHGLCS